MTLPHGRATPALGMPWTWMIVGVAGLLLLIFIRVLKRSFEGIAQARESACAALLELLPAAKTTENEPGTVVVVAGEDRLVLEAQLLLKAGLAARDDGRLLERLGPLVEDALVAQTDPDQLEEELALVAVHLGPNHPLTPGMTLRALFGVDDDGVETALRHFAGDVAPSSEADSAPDTPVPGADS